MKKILCILCLILSSVCVVFACSKGCDKHVYGQVTYTWSSDNAKCTALRSCSNDGCDHQDKETVDTVAQVTQQQSVQLPELTTFTATFTNSAFQTQTKENVQTEVAGIAKIANVGYVALTDAIDYASQGDIIVLLGDVQLTQSLVIDENKDIIIDLNGKVISYVSTLANNDNAIYNKGTLVIQDSSTGQTGKITFLSEQPTTNNGYATNTILNAGTLTIQSGTIENTTTTGVSCAIDTAWYSNSSIKAPKLVINGGKVVSVLTAIRMLGYADQKTNQLVMNGGDVQGYYGVLIHLSTQDNSVAPLIDIDINGGTVISTDTIYNFAIYSYSFGNSYNGVDINISNGTFRGGIALGGGSGNGGQQGEKLTITNGLFTEVFTYKDIDSDINISGGTYDKTPLDYVAEGYQVVSQNGKYVVQVM